MSILARIFGSRQFDELDCEECDYECQLGELTELTDELRTVLRKSQERNELVEARVLELHDRITTGTLGAIKQWVELATARSNGDQKITNALLERWKIDHDNLKEDIKRQRETISGLEATIQEMIAEEDDRRDLELANRELDMDMSDTQANSLM